MVDAVLAFPLLNPHDSPRRQVLFSVIPILTIWQIRKLNLKEILLLSQGEL